MAVHLCIDLGTAFSKAAAWGTGANGAPRPLRIAATANQGDYTVPTAVCISKEGRVYFGHEALERGHDDPNSSAFTGLKQQMTHHGVKPLNEVELPNEYNPTRTRVTIRQALSLYMAFLSRAASKRLRGVSVEGKTLTMPVFGGKRSDNMKNELRLTATSGWELSRDERIWQGWSLRLNDALRLLRRLEQRKPMRDMPAILEEPQAVMASRMATYIPTSDRRMYMIVDVGAGTTDFGLFVSGKVDDHVGVYTIARSKYSLPVGGNNIDDALVKCVLDKSSLRADRRREARASLREQIRPLKEELLGPILESGEPMSFPDAKIELTSQEFIDSLPVQRIRSGVKRAFSERLSKIHVSWLELASKLPRQHDLSVFFVGGGGTLPFLRNVVPERQPQSYNSSPQFYFRVADPNPSWVERRDFRRAWQQIQRIYPQMAVALGGAAVGAGVNEHLRIESELARWGGL